MLDIVDTGNKHQIGDIIPGIYVGTYSILCEDNTDIDSIGTTWVTLPDTKNSGRITEFYGNDDDGLTDIDYSLYYTILYTYPVKRVSSIAINGLSIDKLITLDSLKNKHTVCNMAKLNVGDTFLFQNEIYLVAYIVSNEDIYIISMCSLTECNGKIKLHGTTFRYEKFSWCQYKSIKVHKVDITFFLKDKEE